jgi:hypothetical protein
MKENEWKRARQEVVICVVTTSMIITRRISQILLHLLYINSLRLSVTKVLGGGGRGGGREAAGFWMRAFWWSSGFLNESFLIFPAITLCFFYSCNKIGNKTIARKRTKRENLGRWKSSHGITEQGIGDKGKCRRMDALPHSQKRWQ